MTFAIMQSLAQLHLYVLAKKIIVPGTAREEKDGNKD